MIERRRFSRIIYQAPVQVRQDTVCLETSIRDLSLHGLLLAATEDTVLLSNKLPVSVSFTLPDSDVVISLQAEIVGMDNNSIRLRIQHIDIDSISHLKRLVELNVGDESLLHRELEQLSDLGAD
ncbi:PilZ domain-containing protein [Vibrio sp. SCSIO 43136]|uniref:PilZ domain-containing protein n=1 Tax=Vibrio sp. SCSIO 43136 TaxID=2819101 RepID=UPI002074F619|nr:PilZ domain-containing protein [Vibrio sp. SCSIO 43136]USD64822.1 PilZ domain-containing protein [Vibrio sp. SCSIO 43136]